MNSNLWTRNSILRNERLLHAGMVVLMVICVAGVSVMRNAIAQTVEQIVSNIEESTSLCAQVHELTAAIEQGQKRQEELELKYQAMLDRIPKKIVDSEVLASIRVMAQSTRCNMTDFRPTATQPQKEFQTRSFVIHLEGQFNCLFQFFESLHQLPYVYQIGRLRVQEPSVPGGACRCEVEMRVVFDHVWVAAK